MFLPEVSHWLPRSLGAATIYKKRCCPKKWYEANAINCSVLSFCSLSFHVRGDYRVRVGEDSPCFMSVWERVQAFGQEQDLGGLKAQAVWPSRTHPAQKFSWPPRQRGETEGWEEVF